MEYFTRDRDNVPIMLLGLKRDLRVEGEGVIYPQEVRCANGTGAGRILNLAWLGSYGRAGAPLRSVCGVLGNDGRADE